MLHLTWFHCLAVHPNPPRYLYFSNSGFLINPEFESTTTEIQALSCQWPHFKFPPFHVSRSFKMYYFHKTVSHQHEVSLWCSANLGFTILKQKILEERSGSGNICGQNGQATFRVGTLLPIILESNINIYLGPQFAAVPWWHHLKYANEAGCISIVTYLSRDSFGLLPFCWDPVLQPALHNLLISFTMCWKN